MSNYISNFNYIILFDTKTPLSIKGGRRGPECMVVEFTTTYAISAYHHWCCEFESRSGRGVQHHMIKFVSDLRQVGGFLRVLRFPPPIITDLHDITEILLQVELNTIKQTNKQTEHKIFHQIGWHIYNKYYTLTFILLLHLNNCLPICKADLPC